MDGGGCLAIGTYEGDATTGKANGRDLSQTVKLITSHDIVQRTLFQSLPSLQNPISVFFFFFFFFLFLRRLNALLAGDKVK